MLERILADGTDQALWEFYHENSKLSLAEPHPVFKFRPTDSAVVRVMNHLYTVQPYTDFPKAPLPENLPPSTERFDDVLRNRITARAFTGEPIGLDQLAKVLTFCYGITQLQEDTNFPRDLRVIPSGGALYPLEVFLYAARVEGLAAGLYHYNPERHELDVLGSSDDVDQLRNLFVQPDLAASAAAVMFITAVFARTVFKYGDRGYRFILLEAGHLGQNANLTAQEMGLATVNVGGFLDREADRYLGLDGVNRSTVYALFLGRLAAGRVPAQDTKAARAADAGSCGPGASNGRSRVREETA